MFWTVINIQFQFINQILHYKIHSMMGLKECWMYGCKSFVTEINKWQWFVAEVIKSEGEVHYFWGSTSRKQTRIETHKWFCFVLHSLFALFDHKNLFFIANNNDNCSTWQVFIMKRKTKWDELVCLCYFFP